jgi:hypothetical protein
MQTRVSLEPQLKHISHTHGLFEKGGKCNFTAHSNMIVVSCMRETVHAMLGSWREHFKETNVWILVLEDASSIGNVTIW